MNSRPMTIPPAAVEALRRTVAGVIAYRTDPAYDALLARDDSASHRPPDVVVVPATEAAVAAAVGVARSHGLQLSGETDGSGATMLVLTHDLATVVVDADAGTAVVGPGVTWPALAAALDTPGLHVVPPAVRSAVHATVLESATSGALTPLSARVVRADGFVHVVPGPGAPADETGPWVVTAVEVPLRSVLEPIAHDTPRSAHQLEETPS